MSFKIYPSLFYQITCLKELCLQVVEINICNFCSLKANGLILKPDIDIYYRKSWLIFLMSNAESVQNIHEFLIRTIDRLIKTKSEYLVHKLGRDFAEIPKIRQVNQVMIISQYMGNYYNTNSI